MREGKTFEQFTAERLKKKKALAEGPSPYGVPGVYEDDALFILRAMGRAPWPSAPAETPPAPAPEAPRPEAPDTPKPKRRRLSKAERLERKAAKLRAEIEGLRK